MKIVIAPDKFKGSLSSFEVCDAIEKGLLKASSSLEIIKCPMADGGDGLAEVISFYTKANWQNSKVQNPLGKIISAKWLLSFDKQTAFIEMAKASGLELLDPEQYDPSITSTYGTGQLIKAAIKTHAQKIILGIGGSATNDAGTGMAAALGYRFLGANGKELQPAGKNLLHIEHIDAAEVNMPQGVRFKVACDVKNLLYGEQGATKIYAPQKGADKTMIEALETGMIKFAGIVKKDLGIDISKIEGGGAAGGLGAGCVAFLNAKLISGIDLVMEMASLENQVSTADIVISGEGKIDHQSMQGKVISGVAALTKKHQKKLIVVCGSLDMNESELNALGINSVYCLRKPGMSLQEATGHAPKLLEDLSFTLGSIIKDA